MERYSKTEKMYLIMGGVLQWTTIGNGLMMTVTQKKNLYALMILNQPLNQHQQPDRIQVHLSNVICLTFILINLKCDMRRDRIIKSADNLILVRENLTWTEAASYCRKHHVDLVSIHSEELQNRTARKATQASTSHVWLGLRYTCTFDFWFWIKNREAGCYKNWAPGHGPHGYEDCGLSGAMESTGGYRWVGRPESERLNFICQICTDVF
ncbi:hypothetical protein cypCar_00027239 [Cyprinus carpio]|nr:hypothetical protein cypCar_00027239 [Cyprinus carpio]